METPTESLRRALEDAHGRIDSRLARARRLAASGDRDAKKAFDQFRAALLDHISLEEKMLLPAYDRKASGNGRTAALRRQHAEIRERVDQLSKALEHTTAVENLMTELLGLLCPHEEAEEEHLISIVEEALTDDERRAAVKELRAL